MQQNSQADVHGQLKTDSPLWVAKCLLPWCNVKGLLNIDTVVIELTILAGSRKTKVFYVALYVIFGQLKINAQ